MSFDGIDIDEMFAEAAGAAENTGEKDPEAYGKNPKKVIEKEVVKKEIKPEPKPEVKVEAKSEPKVEPKQKPEIKEEVVERKERLGPLIKQGGVNTNITDKGINVEAISKIIEMKHTLDNYNASELNFVKGYFQNEEGESAEIIYQALTANNRGLDALNKIVLARGKTAAERAFYLMELDHNSIEAIYEQVDLLTGLLGETGRVNEINKIKICRILEKTISDMADDVFTYINKLQEFTNIAISE